MMEHSSGGVCSKHTDLLVCEQVNDGNGSLGSQIHIIQAHHDAHGFGGSGLDPGAGIDPTGAPASAEPSTACFPLPTDPSTTHEDSSIGAHASPSSLGCSSAYSTQSSSSFSLSNSQESSQVISEEDLVFQHRNYKPEEAKDISTFHDDGHFTVQKWEADRRDGDGDSNVGTLLEGSSEGLTNHHSTSDTDKESEGKYVWTKIGHSIIRRPFDTCFGTGWARGDGSLPPPHRTYANEFVIVRKSPLHGYGIFAAVDIKQETHVLLEKPFFAIKSWKQLESEYAGLREEEKAVFDGLFGYHRVHKDPVPRKFSANAFELAYGRRGVLAIASNFNHACHSERNTQYAWDACHEVMTFTAMKDIKKGEELLISYQELRCALYAFYGFICQCGGCQNQAYDVQEY